MSNSGGVSCKKQFQLKNFGFGYDRPYQFYQSEWQWPHWVFVAWRVFWVLWHIGWLIRSIQDQADGNDGEKWLIFLTNWSFLILTIQSILHLVTVGIATHKCRTSPSKSNRDASTMWYQKLLWLFTDVSFNAAIVVTIIYWAFIFERLTKALNIVTHAVTTLYVLTDMMYSATPVRLLHVIYSMLYGLAFTLMSVFYHLGDGTNNNGRPYIYSQIDWNSPGTAAGFSAVLVFVATPIIHLFRFGLYTLRVYMRDRCDCGRRPEEASHSDLEAGVRE